MRRWLIFLFSFFTVKNRVSNYAKIPMAFRAVYASLPGFLEIKVKLPGYAIGTPAADILIHFYKPV